MSSIFRTYALSFFILAFSLTSTAVPISQLDALNSHPIYSNTISLGPELPPDRVEGQVHSQYDYDKMYEFVRTFLTGPRGNRVQKFLKKLFENELKISKEDQERFNLPEKPKGLSVQQFLIILQSHPEAWETLYDILYSIPDDIDGSAEAKEKSKKAMAQISAIVDSHGVRQTIAKYANPLIPFTVKQPYNRGAYHDLKFFANHDLHDNKGNLISGPVNLMAKWIALINKKSTKQIVGNSFDFDLPEMADALIRAKDEGKEIYWGIDNANHAHREPVQAAVTKLKKAGFVIVDQAEENTFSREDQKKRAKKFAGKPTIFLVDAVGLNHQKMMAINWDDEKTAEVLLSSGNPTVSGMHPKGDLAGKKPAFDKDQDKSRPNANHIAILKSQPIAQVIYHQSKMMFEQGLRGSELPLSGVFKFMGPRTQNPDEREYMLLAFSPAGGYGNIGRYLLGEAVKMFPGLIFLSQFAMSSEELENAFLERAKQDKKKIGTLNIVAYIETGFAMREWSLLIKMSGLKRVQEGDIKTYEEDYESPWREVLGEKGLALIRQRLHIAPEPYGKIYRIKMADGTKEEAQAKLHHKLMSIVEEEYINDLYNDAVKFIPGLAVLADSFNFSRGAESNTEQLPIFINSKQSLAFAMSIMYYFKSLNAKTVSEEADRRNAIAKRLTNEKIDIEDIVEDGGSFEVLEEGSKSLTAKNSEELNKVFRNKILAADREKVKNVLSLKSFIQGTNIEINNNLAFSGLEQIKASAFDWDDNIMFMPDQFGIIIYKKGTNEKLVVSTEEFAHIRSCIGVPHCEDKKYEMYSQYEIRTPEGGAPVEQNSFQYFRTGLKGENFFKEAIAHNLSQPIEKWNWMAPNFWEFVDTLLTKDRARFTSIITARGHDKNEVKDGLEYVKTWLAENSEKIFMWLTTTENGKKWATQLQDEYPYIYNLIVSKTPMKLYLPKKKALHAVSNVLYGGAAQSPSETKAMIMVAQLDLLNEHAKQMNAKNSPMQKITAADGRTKGHLHVWEFSDDDAQNIQKAYDLLGKGVAENRWPFVKIILEYTGSAKYPLFKKREQVITPDGGLRAVTSKEQGQMDNIFMKVMSSDSGTCASKLTGKAS